jgi:cholesterol 7-dehydrogenase
MPFPTGDALLISSLLGGCFTILDLGRRTKRQPLEPLYLITAGAVGIISFFAVRAATSTFTWLRRHANENASKVSNTQVEIIRKRGTRLPPPYPSGWYVVAVSNELKPGNVTSVTVCGKNLVVFRTLDNTVGILDAYCSHLGAHLAFGSQSGSVTTDCLKCPFHGWCFDHHGELRSAPTADAPIGSKQASIKSWTSIEQNGVILVWMSSDTDMPVYSIPICSQIESQSYIYRGFVENITDCHINDIAENGADVSHLDTVHYPFVFPSFSPLLSHTWKATWIAGEDERSHIADMTVLQSVCLLGIPLPGGVRVEIQQVGLSLVLLDMHTPVGRLFVVESVTPISPLKQRVLHTVYADPLVPAILVQAVMAAHIIHHEKDVPIWANKKLLPSGEAFLLTSDSNIALYRRWAKRFISEKSMSFEESVRIHSEDLIGTKSLDW